MSGIIYTGYDNNSRYYMRWWLVGQEIENNRSLVGWEIGLQGTAGRTSYWYSNALRINSGYVDGAHVCGSQTYSNITLQGDGLRGLRSGSHWIGHNADGARSFGMSVSGWFYGAGDRNASGSFGLPTIPRNSQVSTNLGSYTLGDPITINTNRKSTAFTHSITIRLNNSGGTVLQTINNVADSTTWTPDAGQITAMQNAIPNSNTLNLFINSYNNQVAASSSVNRTITLTNANPTYTNFTFKDSDTATVAVTGDDQVLVKGKSTLEVKVPSADKMVALKGSTAVRYDVAYDGVSNQATYDTIDVTSSFATVSTIGNRTIQVTAIDSRTNATKVSKPVTVYDYAVPTILTTLTRLNNFDNDTTIHIEGTYTPLNIGGTNKNALTTSTLQYRYKETGGTFGSWVTKTFTPNTTAGTFSVTDFVVALDNTKKFEFEFHISDAFGTVTTTNLVDVGIPIMFIGQNSGSASMGINKMPTSGALDVAGDIYANGEKVSVYTPINYSTTEQDTGKTWTDGRPIYRKVLLGNITIAVGMNTIAHGITAISSLEIVSFTYSNRLSSTTRGSSIYLSWHREAGGGLNWTNPQSIDSTNLSFYASWAWGPTAYTVIMEYVK